MTLFFIQYQDFYYIIIRSLSILYLLFSIYQFKYSKRGCRRAPFLWDVTHGSSICTPRSISRDLRRAVDLSFHRFFANYWKMIPFLCFTRYTINHFVLNHSFRYTFFREKKNNFICCLCSFAYLYIIYIHYYIWKNNSYFFSLIGENVRASKNWKLYLSLTFSARSYIIIYT